MERVRRTWSAGASPACSTTWGSSSCCRSACASPTPWRDPTGPTAASWTSWPPYGELKAAVLAAHAGRLEIAASSAAHPGGDPSEWEVVDAGEVAKFEALASRWWDADGEFRPLHEINPLRLDWIR